MILGTSQSGRHLDLGLDDGEGAALEQLE